jgi:DNA-binding HxlR family transcriptional regulator
MAISANRDHLEGLSEREVAVLDFMRERGGTTTRSALAKAIEVSPATTSRLLRHLVEQGRVSRSTRGSYRLEEEASRSLSTTAAQIVAAIEESGSEAHLTGMDLLAAHAHQFVRGFPHLVYADPDALDQVAYALSQAGFLPVAPGPHVRNLLAHSPDIDRVVVLRGQPTARMTRFGVRSEVAPPEKAWLDLLRETKAGNAPWSMADVGAIWASLLLANIDAQQLGRWAREMGLDRYVRALTDADADSDAPELQELKAGAAR